MNLHFIIKKFLILFFLLIHFIGRAQVNLEFTTINEYAFNTREALNFIVTNGYTKSVNVIFNGRIKDGAGNPVAEFKTQEAVLNTGANIFTPMTLSIADIQYANHDIAEIENVSGTYPGGNYTICIWPSCVTPDCNGLGQNAVSMEEPKCISVHIENPTPLILATPQNEAEIEETRPLYTWIPPAPVAASSNLNYTMILVEILEGQNKADALTQNRPLIEVEGIGNPSLMHPSDLPELEKGKWYAWQVQAFVGRTPIAKSEQWKFKVKNEEKKNGNRFFDLNISSVSEIPKIKRGDKLFFMIDNGMLDEAPVFSVRSLNGKYVKATFQRVTKDSLVMAYDELSSDLVHKGMTKYCMLTDLTAFRDNAVYEMTLSFNNIKSIFRFEIID